MAPSFRPEPYTEYDQGEAEYESSSLPEAPEWGLPDPVSVARKKPVRLELVPPAPARKKPRDPNRDYFTVAEIAAEFHWGPTYVRKWFTEHPAGCQASGHGELLHTRKCISLRIGPEGRRRFMEAHHPKVLRLG